MKDLKRCPFCGGEAEIHERYRKGTPNRKLFWVECKACWVAQYHGDIGGYRTRSKATEAWNRRDYGDVPSEQQRWLEGN